MAFLEALRRDLLGAAVGLHPLGQRPGAAERLVEPAMRVAVALRVALGDVHVEIGLDLVDEADGLTGEFPSRTGQGAQMGADVVGARVVEARRRRGSSASSRSACRARSAGSGAGSDGDRVAAARGHR